MAVLHNYFVGDDEPLPEVEWHDCVYCGGQHPDDAEDRCEDYHAYQRSIDPDYGDDTYECS